MKRIYLDNSATTKPDKAVILAMNEVAEKYWGNASSIYAEGQVAKQMLEDCRRTFAFFIGCKPEEIIFTSGGTEADSLAIKGIIDAFYSQIKSSTNADFDTVKNNAEGAVFQPRRDQRSYLNIIPHVITSAFEHHAVLDTVKDLERRGLVEATYIKPNKDGLIEVKDVEAAIEDNTVLVSIMYVNNEVGTVQPIKQIGDLLKKQKSGNIYFHTDAVQAVEYFELSPKYLGVDLMSIAAHKFNGPKGVGALYVREGTPFVRQQIGGSQEGKRRAGTENIAGIRGMVVAYEQIFKRRADEGIEDPEKINMPELKLDKTTKEIQKLRDKLIDGLLKNIPNTKLNGSRERRSPANANISFLNAEGESIIMLLDVAGVSVSSGSACTSGSLDPSHVLLSMGVPHEEAHGSIRFTLSKHITDEEINKVLEILPPIIDRLRKMSPFK
jgi:cysteine desulfurase